MKKWLKVLLWIVAVVAVVALAVVIFVVKTPADYDLPYEDVTVTTADGVELPGWYIASENGAAVMVQHGILGARQGHLAKAAILHRNGYGVLLTTTGCHEGREDGRMMDLEAWYQYLLTRADVDPDRIGMIGESFGGAMSIKYAAENHGIRAVISQSSFASLEDAIEIGNFVPFPPPLRSLLAPLILSREAECAGMEVAEVVPVDWIKGISPRPVLILHGGVDDYVAADSGQRLYDAAGEPKEIWVEPEADHKSFDEIVPPAVYEERLVSFIDQYLLGPAAPSRQSPSKRISTSW
jgi:fermentation-respiration switch protein FrsA (DUF1100 family)